MVWECEISKGGESRLLAAPETKKTPLYINNKEDTTRVKSQRLETSHTFNIIRAVPQEPSAYSKWLNVMFDLGLGIKGCLEGQYSGWVWAKNGNRKIHYLNIINIC